MHTPIEFYVVVPLDLYRVGSPSKPRFDYLRTSPPRTELQVFDVKVDPKTNVIDSKSGGLSLFSRPNFEFSKDWWVIPKGTKLPRGFTLSKDLTGDKLKGHFSVRSMIDIHVDVWRRTLLEWAEENAVHIKDYASRKGVKNV